MQREGREGERRLHERLAYVVRVGDRASVGRTLGGKPGKGLFYFFRRTIGIFLVLLVWFLNEHQEKARAPRTKLGT